MKKGIEIKKLFLSCLIIFTSIFIALSMQTQEKNSIKGLESEPHQYLASNTNKFIYLSDLDYITTNNWSYNGWEGHNIQKDKNQEGGALSLIIDGERRSFPKGIGLHARGQVTFDIEGYSTEFPRFIAKLGVDASRGTNGSIWFQIYVSNDGTTWTSLLKTDTLSGTSNAIDVDVRVEGYKYLRIYVDPNGSNAADHGTIANAKLVANDYENTGIFYDKIHKVEYYDEILNKHDAEYNYNNNYRLILERELVNKLGFWNIQYTAEANSNFEELMEWVLKENRILEEMIEVGEIANTNTFIKVLSDLYHKHKDDLKTTNGYVYEKMMIGLAAAYATDRIITPLAFSFQTPTYDYMERFAIMKRYFDNNEFRRVETNSLAGHFVPNEWFKNYHVELMRMVMQDGTSNGDLIWLNGFTNEKQSVSFYMIGYVSPNFMQDKYYSEANREKYDTQFYLTKYGVPYGLVNGTKIPRYWMIFANGGICWNASRAGQSMYRVNGIPATGAYQVGHELYIQYYETENGDGYWTPRYGNWSGAGSTWGGSNPYRYIFNWNNKYFTTKHISGSRIASSTGYLYLGQANLNRYEEYKKSLYYNLTANSYTNNNQKLDSYFKALEVNDLNLDSYDAIITLYKSMSVQNGGTITSHDWYSLAKKIIKAYSYYPVAMFDLIKVIRPYLDGAEKLDIDRLEKETLQLATQATGTQTIQVDGVRTHARQLLNQVQPDPMSFSFDGADAGKIVKNPMYSLAWGYSLDGGQTFTDYKIDDAITLTKEELARITAENDIIIHFMGLSYTFRIDITEGELSNLLFGNDLENRVVGIDLTYEWRNREDDDWTSYATASPNNTGNKTLHVRKRATGTQLASESQTFTFTEDNQPNTRKYVPVSHLSIEGYSTQSVDTARPFYAPNAIDGNGKTLWHTDFRENVLTSETKPYLTIKLDKPRYISALEFKQLKYRSDDPAYIKNARIYISEDSENWVEAGKIENCPQNEELRIIDFDESVYGEYIKIEMDTYGIFSSLSLVNIFQDMTKNPRPTAGIGYSPTESTNGNVIARLVNPSTNITITNNNGSDTYIFTENGDFTFEFVDDQGTKGTSKAKVNWIDRTAPTATIEYSTTSPTNQTVIATLKPSEEVIVTNNGEYKVDADGDIIDADGNKLNGYTVDDDGNVKDANGTIIANMNTFTYEFLSNGEFTFEFMDKAGNRGSAVATVTWIDHDAPNATLTYNIDKLTNQNVIVTVNFDENVIVTNNGGNYSHTFTDNGEFTFTFRDLAGNVNQITAKVDWIDKVIPTAKLKYERKENKVIVHVIDPSEAIVFKDGYGVYEFTKDGHYDIYFYDRAKNMGKVTAVITGLNEENENINTGDHTNTNTASNSSNTKPKNHTISTSERKKLTKNTIDEYDETIDDTSRNESKLEDEKESFLEEKNGKKEENRNNKTQDEKVHVAENRNDIIPIVIGFAFVIAVIIFIVKRVSKI